MISSDKVFNIQDICNGCRNLRVYERKVPDRLRPALSEDIDTLISASCTRIAGNLEIDFIESNGIVYEIVWRHKHCLVLLKVRENEPVQETLRA